MQAVVFVSNIKQPKPFTIANLRPKHSIWLCLCKEGGAVYNHFGCWPLRQNHAWTIIKLEIHQISEIKFQKRPNRKHRHVYRLPEMQSLTLTKSLPSFYKLGKLR